MKNLKEARTRAGLSQTELATRLSVTQATISNWENGRGGPSEDQMARLQTVLDVGPSTNAPDASPLAAWLIKARSSKGWTVPELAHKAGLSSPGVYRIENGITRNLREATRQKLEQALGVPVPTETLQEVAEEAEIKGLGSLVDFDPHSDDERPVEPGIYVFYDISERPIYVGEARNVKIRIRGHEDKFWFKRPIVESASWIKVEDETLRKQIEALLIKFLKSNAVINKQHVDRG